MEQIECNLKLELEFQPIRMLLFGQSYWIVNQSECLLQKILANPIWRPNRNESDW